MGLSPVHKLFYLLLRDECDNAGVWKKNFRLAEFLIGSKLDEGKILEAFGDKIEVLPCGKWWLVGFVEEQCKGAPSAKNGPQRQIISLLKEHGLLDRFDIPTDESEIPSEKERVSVDYRKGSDTLQDKDKDKEKDSSGDCTSSKGGGLASAPEDRIKAWIDGMLGKDVAWTAKERALLKENVSVFRSLSAANQGKIEDYYRAALDGEDRREWWRPDDRWRFVGNITSVLDKAQKWRRIRKARQGTPGADISVCHPEPEGDWRGYDEEDGGVRVADDIPWEALPESAQRIVIEAMEARKITPMPPQARAAGAG